MNRRLFVQGFLTSAVGGLGAALFGKKAMAADTSGAYGIYGAYSVYGVYGTYGTYGGYGQYGAYGPHGGYGIYGYGPYYGYSLEDSVEIFGYGNRRPNAAGGGKKRWANNYYETMTNKAAGSAGDSAPARKRAPK